MLLPQQALMLPQYLILQQLGLLDTLAGLLLVTAFGAICGGKNRRR